MSDAPTTSSVPVREIGQRRDSTRILPISSIRFILAACVVVFHAGNPFFTAHQASPLLWAARAFLNNAVNGMAAVMVFFVVSGFCIHYPNRNGLAVRSWRAYYARRYLRVLVPMAAAMLIARPLRIEFGLFSGSILWSLVCEEIYYFFYPFLLALQVRIGWKKLMAAAWILSYLVVLAAPARHAFYGPALTWVWGYPSWLLGCVLAEKSDSLKSISIRPRAIWGWRTGAWLLSVLVSMLEFHSRLGNPWTLNLFSIYAYFWIRSEICCYRAEGREPVFEKLGESSYSMYLIHIHGFALFGLLLAGAPLPEFASWCGKLVFAALVATAFYWCVERPSHGLARMFGGNRSLRFRATATAEVPIPQARAAAAGRPFHMRP